MRTNEWTAKSFARMRSWAVARFVPNFDRSKVMAVRRGERDLAGAGDGWSSGLTVYGGGGRRWVEREKGREGKRKRKEKKGEGEEEKDGEGEENNSILGLSRF